MCRIRIEFGVPEEESGLTRRFAAMPGHALRIEIHHVAAVQLADEQLKALCRTVSVPVHPERLLRGLRPAIAAILSAIRELLHPPVPKRRAIGFTADLEEKLWAGAGNELISGGRLIPVPVFARGIELEEAWASGATGFNEIID